MKQEMNTLNYYEIKILTARKKKRENENNKHNYILQLIFAASLTIMTKAILTCRTFLIYFKLWMVIKMISNCSLATNFMEWNKLQMIRIRFFF